MIQLKNSDQIRFMAEGGKIASEVLTGLKGASLPGVSTLALDRLAHQEIEKRGASPSFLHVPGYRFATCLTVNSGVVHGLPGSYTLKKGDLLGIDLGVYFRGLHTDVAQTILVGEKEEGEKALFLKTGRSALASAIRACRVGARVGDVSAVIEESVRRAGFYPASELAGHGVGRHLHEGPLLPCVGKAGEGIKFEAGLTLAIEVLYSASPKPLVLQPDGWTITTSDGAWGAIFEKTVVLLPGLTQELTP